MPYRVVISLVCLSLTWPHLYTVVLQTKEGQFIEASLCGSGQTIRIPLGGDEEEEQTQVQACHALCSRDSEEESSSNVTKG